MNEKLATPTEQTLTYKDHKALIAKYPLFSLLSSKDIKELAEIAKEVSVQAGTVITREGEIVDSVYLIVSGTADVSCNVTTAGKTTPMHIAILGEGDAIGLAKTGFFSPRGIRTATVTATSAMLLLSIDIKSFQRFLQKPEITYPTLKNAGEMILLMNFLQESHLFSHLTPVKIHRLAKIVKKRQLKPGVMLFKEGDAADECYFLLSGKVTVTTTGAKEKITKLMEAQRSLGEDDFVKNKARSFSAQTTTECELFVLDRELVKEVETMQQSMAGEVLSDMLDKVKNFWNK